MRPTAVGAAGAALILGAVLGLSWDLAIAAASLGLCCTTWTWGPLVSLVGLVGGLAAMNVRSAAGRALGGLGALALVSDAVDLNPVAVVCGAVALVQLTRPEASAWYAGTWTPPQPPALSAGESGVVLSSDFVPLAFLLYASSVRLTIDGGPPQKLPWGRCALALPPGPHELRCEVPYLTGPIHSAKLAIEVPAGRTVAVHYHAPGWLVFLAGTLTVRAD